MPNSGGGILRALPVCQYANSESGGLALTLVFRLRQSCLVRVKIHQVFIVLPLICAIGGHWAILQSVAWAGMAASYLQQVDFKHALLKTFDGRHPCKLCKAVQAGKKCEQKQPLLKAETKLDLCLPREVSRLNALHPFAQCRFDSQSAPLRAEAPPSPPPRPA